MQSIVILFMINEGKHFIADRFYVETNLNLSENGAWRCDESLTEGLQVLMKTSEWGENYIFTLMN